MISGNDRLLPEIVASAPEIFRHVSGAIKDNFSIRPSILYDQRQIDAPCLRNHPTSYDSGGVFTNASNYLEAESGGKDIGYFHTRD